MELGACQVNLRGLGKTVLSTSASKAATEGSRGGYIAHPVRELAAVQGLLLASAAVIGAVSRLLDAIEVHGAAAGLHKAAMTAAVATRCGLALYEALFCLFQHVPWGAHQTARFPRRG